MLLPNREPPWFETTFTFGGKEMSKRSLSTTLAITLIAAFSVWSMASTDASAQGMREHGAHSAHQQSPQFGQQHQSHLTADRPTPHGGQFSVAGSLHFEVVYLPQETRVYLYDALNRPISTKGVAGQVAMTVRGYEKVYRYPLAYVATQAGSGIQDYLAVAVNVSRIKDGDMAVAFELTNLPSRDLPGASVKQMFALSKLPVTVAILDAADGPRIEQQKVCAVTGGRLGSMGRPVKVLLGDQPIYLCCKGCLGKVQKNPVAYLPKSTPAQPARSTQSTRSAWTCSMHPQVKMPKPGKCPICGMELVPDIVIPKGRLRDFCEAYVTAAMGGLEIQHIEHWGPPWLIIPSYVTFAGQKAVPRLRKMLDNKHLRVIAGTADQLGKLGDREAIPKLKQLLASKRLQWYDQLEVLQYIDDLYVCYYLVSTQPVRPEMARSYQQSQGYKRLSVWEHGLRKCPVVFAPGVKTDEQEYEFRFKPFLADAEEDLYMYDFLLSRLATMVKAFYFPSFIWGLGRPSTEFQGQDRPEEGINIGGTTTKYSDEEIEPISMPTNLPDADMLQRELDSLIQRNTLEDVLFGRVQGDTAAFAIRLRINVAKNKLVPYVKSMAVALMETYDLVTRSVEHLGEEVIIDGEEITPAMAIAARGRISVAVDPRLPGEEGIDLQKAAMAVNLRLPEAWIWETILGIDDPATLSLLRDVQELEELPEVKERLLQEALEMLQVRIEDEETMAILDVLDQFGDQLDPEVVAALQALATGQTTGEAGGAPPPPPPGGLGRGPFPDNSSNQAVGGGRGLDTVNAPTPSNIETGEAGVGSEEPRG
ncbi:hypothetical protein LCGC14_1715810 [marine sediment metagenome]|uniref:Heavy metal binding domain-containing protein n=1 Tax=marine sediment metagenome TaxID=412755 RepID=A0A0F9HDL0_9ZZZZ